MHELKIIGGKKVLFFNDANINIREEILNYKDKDIDLVIVGNGFLPDESKLTEILKGRSLGEVITEKNKSEQLNIEQITSMQTRQIIIENLPTMVEPFFPHNHGWRGEPKWYDKYKNKKRKKK